MPKIRERKKNSKTWQNSITTKSVNHTPFSTSYRNLHISTKNDWFTHQSELWEITLLFRKLESGLPKKKHTIRDPWTPVIGNKTISKTSQCINCKPYPCEDALFDNRVTGLELIQSIFFEFDNYVNATRARGIIEIESDALLHAKQCTKSEDNIAVRLFT